MGYYRTHTVHSLVTLGVIEVTVIIRMSRVDFIGGNHHETVGALDAALVRVARHGVAADDREVHLDDYGSG